MVGRVRYSPELVAKVVSMRAAGRTQLEVAKHFGIDPRTVRKIENMQAIPSRAADPEQLKNEWFGVLATRIRLAAATDDNAAISELIKAGAALLNTPDPTGITQGGEAEPTSKPTLKDIKAIKSTVIRVPMGKHKSEESKPEEELNRE